MEKVIHIHAPYKIIIIIGTILIRMKKKKKAFFPWFSTFLLQFGLYTFHQVRPWKTFFFSSWLILFLSNLFKSLISAWKVSCAVHCYWQGIEVRAICALVLSEARKPSLWENWKWKIEPQNVSSFSNGGFKISPQMFFLQSVNWTWIQIWSQIWPLRTFPSAIICLEFCKHSCL